MSDSPITMDLDARLRKLARRYGTTIDMLHEDVGVMSNAEAITILLGAAEGQDLELRRVVDLLVEAGLIKE